MYASVPYVSGQSGMLLFDFFQYARMLMPSAVLRLDHQISFQFVRLTIMGH